MLLRVSRFFPAFAFIVLAFPVIAQTIARIAPAKPGQPATYHAYTAEFKITRVQTLANGTTITHESTEHWAVDSSGRYAQSITETTPGAGGSSFTHVHVHDPVADTDADWNSRVKKAAIIKLPPEDQHQGCWANEAGAVRFSYGGSQPASVTTQPRPQPVRNRSTSEDLGTTSIQGFEATGRRTSTTIPAGQVGNDQPIVTSDETWWSKGLGFGLVLRSVHDDPRTGTSTRELVSLTLGEPDPASFQPPEGYEVKTEELHEVQCQQ